ncbi:hypothetical protein D3C78_1305980 [compost metagenome]
MAPTGDIYRATEGAGRIERRIHLHHHTISDDALGNQLFRFLRRHFCDALPFSVEDATDIRQQDQIRTQGGGQSRRRLIGVHIH